MFIRTLVVLYIFCFTSQYSEEKQWVLPIVQGYIEIRHIEIPSPEFLGPFTNISADMTASKSDEPGENSEAAVPLADLTALEEDTHTVFSDTDNEEETSFAEEHARTPADTGEDKEEIEPGKADEVESKIVIKEENNGREDSPFIVNHNSDIPVIVVEEVDDSADASEPEQKRLWRNSQVLEEDQEGGLPKMAVALISRRSRHRAG